VEYQPTRESIDKHAVPGWFHEAKFGIFIHWSLFCVTDKGDIMDILSNEGSRAMLANQPYSEWYLNSLRIKGSPVWEYHMKTYGADFDYYDFAEDFNDALDAWQPAGWADLFRQVGARYVVLVTKHHDGFLLWPSEHPNPMSSPYDWTFTGKPVTDLALSLARIPGSKKYKEYVNSHWRELIDRYGPSVLWSDIGYPGGVNVNEVFAHYYNRIPDGAVNERWGQTPGFIKALVLLPGIRQAVDRKATRLWLEGQVSPAGVHHDFVTPEYTSFSDIREEKWECVRGIGKSFGYNRQEQPDDFLSVSELVRLLIDVVSKNGNLLLNIGPKADGGRSPGARFLKSRSTGSGGSVPGFR